MSEIETRPVKGNFDMQHLQKIHKEIYQDTFDWAGEIRTLDITRIWNHKEMQKIMPYSQKLFQELKEENYLLGYSKDKLADRLGYYLTEMDNMHPFKEGNIRSYQEFIRCLAAFNGYRLYYQCIDDETMFEAAINHKNMGNVLKSNMMRISYKEQFNWCKLLAPEKGELQEAYTKYFKYINRLAADIETSTGVKAGESIIKKMEHLNQVAGKKLSVKGVFWIMQGRHGLINTEVVEAAKDFSKALTTQEKQQSQVSEPEP
jgi:cell filamentation protein